ncbi:GFA family protein [Haliangium ochraceum]|uniref:Glutathione-dependent formaldehyde-activating GFA n=1 Tax=Haliangium ochraceum (strain DSM 14365 / JCM 11303 / SMP-2) TaxID=502025 RepID=D0LW55_HALO1|nr:GFA family protein [Haliangium ochraceum]ACY15987.1 glutathione-dependent formaldehyde-activating GFA [Haliangium ochraceum DSM 14365]
MKLEGSCHCRAVTFTVISHTPYPYNYCYCGICRKTAGAGGFAINIAADHRTLEVRGREHIRVYRASYQNPEDGAPRTSTAERSFCDTCGSALWCFHPEWPDAVYPHASTIDTPLPRPPERTHLMLDFAAPWVPVHADIQDRQHPRYPEESIAAWHERLGIADE